MQCVKDMNLPVQCKSSLSGSRFADKTVQCRCHAVGGGRVYFVHRLMLTFHCSSLFFSPCFFTEWGSLYSCPCWRVSWHFCWILQTLPKIAFWSVSAITRLVADMLLMQMLITRPVLAFCIMHSWQDLSMCCHVCDLNIVAKCKYNMSGFSPFECWWFFSWQRIEK